ncbi:MAG TPA: acyl-CoA thioesterase [Hyphomicrobiales bacterium]|nr:acyl-CoA thioesterase [Hyphomicrobiales bacterium]
MSIPASDLDLDPNPYPVGELALQTIPLLADTNQHGLIHGGWLASQMDMAASIASTKVARGKVATVAIEYISFLSPIQLGVVVGCYTKVRGVGRSSVRVEVEAWVNEVTTTSEWVKVAVGCFVFVAVDDNGRTRAIPKNRD